MALINIENLSFKYEREEALRNISFTVEKGEYICLIGSNGSGKSTLLKLLLNLLPCQSGKIVRNIPPDKIGYAAQMNAVNRNFPATSWEIIISGTQKSSFMRLPFYSKEDKGAAEAALKLAGCGNIKNSRIGNLSGGQQQRVMLARALVKKPELLILDEPCAALDPKITSEIYELLANLNKKSGITLLVATHDLEQVKKYASRVIEIDTEIKFNLSANEWNL